MSKIYKLRLLQDLPEYPADCVFILDENGWRGYWENGNWTLPSWLEDLLYTNIPEISTEMTEWFSPIDDEESTTYVVNMSGDIREHKIYSFWVFDSNTVMFETREEAERFSQKLIALREGGTL
jgi:hypothetical protein